MSLVTRLTPDRIRACLAQPFDESSSARGVPRRQFPEWRSAGVLITLFDTPQAPHILLTRRAQHLRHHPGQVSFPGGALEAHDVDVVAAALREADEEVGVQVSRDHVLGQLPGYRTISGFEVTPVVAWLPAAPEGFVLDESEVAEAFTAPAPTLLDPSAYRRKPIQHEGQHFTIYSLSLGVHTVWGATAAMLVALGERLQAMPDTAR